ncbi:MAG: hypothetical protein ACRCYU_23585 [Nocardioides sp.]
MSVGMDEKNEVTEWLLSGRQTWVGVAVVLIAVVFMLGLVL